MTTAEKLRKQGLERGLLQGKQAGLEEGEKKAKLENARRMIEEGFADELIIKITGLPRDEVKGLRG